MATQLSTRPPVVKGLPLIGNLIPMMRDTLGFFRREYQRLGPIFQVKILSHHVTVLAGTEAVELMASNDGSLSNWDVWEGVSTEFGGEKNLGMMDGESHSRYRKIMRQGFSRDTITGNIPRVIEMTQQALAGLKAGDTFAVMPFTRRLVSQQIGVLTIGRDPGEYLDDFVEYWQTVVQVRMAKAWPEKRLKSPAYVKARRRVEEMARQILAEHQTKGTEFQEGTFADDLIRATADNPDLISSEGDLLFNLLTPYVAGLDTVANTAGFMLYHIAADPALYARLKTEVDAAFVDGMPTPSKLRQMDVMHATAMETMRSYPITGILMRDATRDFEFHGYQVKQGERLMMAIGAQNHVAKVFTQPERFDVDRFLEPRNEHKQRGALAPFGAGAHTCLGAGMAEVQLALTVATILRDVKLDLTAPNYRIKPVYDPSLSPGNAFQLRVTSRLS